MDAVVVLASVMPTPARRRAPRVRLTVNGRAVEREVAVRQSLADFLRHDLGSPARTWAASTASAAPAPCFVDGASARSCLLFAAQLDGAAVTTIEGLTPPDGLSPLQQAFCATHAMQCGFCTPGMIVTATELLRANPAPSPDGDPRGPRRATSACARATSTSSARSPRRPARRESRRRARRA